MFTIRATRQTARVPRRRAAAIFACVGVLAFGGPLAAAQPRDVGAPAPSPAERRARERVPLAEIRGVTLPEAPATRAADELPMPVRRLYENALELVDDEKYSDAIAQLDTALQASGGDNYSVLYLLAVCKARLGRNGEARLAAESAAALRPGACDAHVLLGDLYEQQGQLDRAQAHYRTATLAADRELNNPRVTAAWFHVGRVLAAESYLTAAVEAFERFDDAIFEDAPEHREARDVATLLVDRPYGAFEMRIDLLARMGRADEVLRVSRTALARKPDDPYLARRHVRALLDAQRADEAWEFVNERNVVRPRDTARDDPRAAARARGLLTLAAEAAVAAKQADTWVAWLEADLTSAAPAGAVAFALDVAERLDRFAPGDTGLRLWHALARVRPDHADVAWGRAAAQCAHGQARAAVEGLIDFVRRVALAAPAATAPGEADVAAPPAATARPHALVTDRFGEWLRGGPPVEPLMAVVEEYTANRRRDPDPATDFVLATAAAAAGQHALADELFKACVAARADFVGARLAWAQTLVRQYRWDDARAQLDDVLKAAPDLPLAHGLRAEVLSGLDENTEADKAYKSALRLAEPSAGDGALAREAARYALGLARLNVRLNDALAAQRFFQQASTLDPSNGEALEGLINSYLDSGKLEIARAQLERAELADLPADVLRRVRTAVRFAQAIAQLGDDAEARDGRFGAAPRVGNDAVSAISSRRALATRYREEHLAELARQCAAHPDDDRTALRLAAGLAAQGNVDEAWRVVEQARTAAPQDEDVLSWTAQLQAGRLEYGAAIAALETLAQRYPNRVEVISALADANLADFRLAEGRALLRRLISPPIADRVDEAVRRRVRARLYSSYLLFGEYDAAIAFLDEWKPAEPNSTEIPGWHFDVLVRADRRREAVAEAASYLDEKPSDRVRRLTFIEVCLRAEEYAAAEEKLRAWIKDEPDNTGWTVALVELMLQAKRGDEALNVTQTIAPQSKGAEIELRALVARCHSVAGKHSDAAAELEALLEDRIVQADPSLVAELRSRLAQVLVDAGQFDDALARIDRWVAALPRAAGPTFEFLLRIKRGVQQAAGRDDEYLQTMEQLYALDPTDPAINNDLGYTLVDRHRDLARATRMIRRAVAGGPFNAAFLDSLGWACYKAGDFAAARQWLGRAVKLRDGRDAVILSHLGDADARLGDPSSARRSWREARDVLDKADASTLIGERAKLGAELRAKLDALDRNVPPPLAPTHTESQDEEHP
ncbi:MAG: tetratricopeptide repeat protein [Phycisphaerae bacterium]